MKKEVEKENLHKFQPYNMKVVAISQFNLFPVESKVALLFVLNQ